MAGAVTLDDDPAVLRPDGPTGGPARVLVASPELTGPTGNGGVGTAYHSLACALAAAGHEVTALYTGWLDPVDDAQIDAWRAAYAAEGVEFALLGTPWAVPVRSPHHGVRRAYELHRWLVNRHQPFNVLHVPEFRGHGALVGTAKALGRAHASLEIVVGAHSSTRWVAEGNREAFGDLDPLVTEWLERTSVARADVLLSPTAYLVDYMRSRGWTLPARTLVQPLLRPRAAAAVDAAAAPAGPLDELLFFGRLETRKGLEAFCDAVDTVLASDSRSRVRRVTFLGRPERVLGEPADAYVARRAASWDVAWELLGDLDHAAAIDVLRTRPAIVVMPSLVDNSPNTVIEAVALGRPVLAARSGGITELLSPDDLDAFTFAGWPAGGPGEPVPLDAAVPAFDAGALAAGLRARLAAGPARARLAIDDATNAATYDRWHRAAAARSATGPDPASGTATEAGAGDAAGTAGVADPRHVADTAGAGDTARGTGVTVGACVVAPDAQRADEIVAALDAGTRRPDAVVTVTEQGRAAGPARRAAAAGLDTDVVLVLRAQDRPEPGLVDAVASAMARSPAGVLGLVTRDGPDADDLHCFVPTGGPALAGILYPALLVGPYAIRRSVLEAVGGFAADTGGPEANREVLAAAALAGVRFDVLPEPVAVTVQPDPWTALRTGYWGEVAVPVVGGEAQLHVERPFRRVLDERLADLPALLAGALHRADDARADGERERQEIVDVYEQSLAEHRALIAQYEARLTEQASAGEASLRARLGRRLGGRA